MPEYFIPVSDQAAVAGRLSAMDAMGIDMQVLSVNPFWYRKDRDTAAAVVKLTNERLAELGAAYPRRLAGFAALSLQYPDLAVQQLETAVKQQGLRGAAIGASVAGDDFHDPKFHPVWAKAEALGAGYSYTRKARPNWRNGSGAMAGCRTRSAIRWTPRSHCST